MKKLSERHLTLLTHAATIGFQFDLTVLGFLLRTDELALSQDLLTLIGEGLVESTHIEDELCSDLGLEYQFHHDQIHQAAQSLLPEVTKSRLHARIGAVLKSRLQPADSDFALFKVADHLT